MSAAMMSVTAPSVLVVDDEALIAKLWSIHVINMGYTVCGTAATAAGAIRMAEEHRPDLVLMDMRLRGDRDGVDAALIIHQSVGSKVIFITGSKEKATIDRIQMDHPAAVLFKPVSDRQLQNAIRAALEDAAPAPRD